MSYAILPENAVVALPVLSGSAAKVLIAVASFMRDREQGCFPSRIAIGERAGIDRPKTVSAAIKELVAAGVLECKHRKRQTNLMEWTDQGRAVSAPLKPLGRAVSAPIDGIQGRAVSAHLIGAETAPLKYSIEGKQTTFPTNDEKPPRRSSPAMPSEEPNQQGEKVPIPFPQGNHPPPPAPAPAGKTIDPKVTWDGKRLTVPNELRESWREAYPYVDLDVAIKRASSWCLSNPVKRPKKNFAKFLNGWLGKVKASSPEYIDPEERATTDAELIRGADLSFPDPDERADYWWRCKCRGEYVPSGVECREMPVEKEAVV